MPGPGARLEPPNQSEEHGDYAGKEHQARRSREAEGRCRFSCVGIFVNQDHAVGNRLIDCVDLQKEQAPRPRMAFRGQSSVVRDPQDDSHVLLGDRATRQPHNERLGRRLPVPQRHRTGSATSVAAAARAARTSQLMRQVDGNRGPAHEPITRQPKIIENVRAPLFGDGMDDTTENLTQS